MTLAISFDGILEVFPSLRHDGGLEMLHHHVPSTIRPPVLILDSASSRQRNGWFAARSSEGLSDMAADHDQERLQELEASDGLRAAD